MSSDIYSVGVVLGFRARRRRVDLSSDTTTNTGLELLGTVRRPPFALTGTYTFVNARESEGGQRVALALTPRHSAGVTRGLFDACTDQ